MQKINRVYECEIRADEEGQRGKQITGRPIVYSQRTNIGGMFDEIIDAGALDATDLRDVPLLVNHDTSGIPCARSRNNNANSTMQLMADEGGLCIRADLDTEHNATASALYSACARGDITGMSFAFTVGADRWEDLDTDTPTRHITQIDRVFEVSAVTFPAYPQTSIDARDAEALDSAKAALESVKKAAEERSRKIAQIKTLLEVMK